MTFLQMQTRVGEQINQTVTDDTKTVTLTEVKANLNIGYHKAVNSIVKVDENYYEQLSKANLVADQSTYSLPTDLRRVTRLEVGYDVSTTRYEAIRMDKTNDPDPNSEYSQSRPVYYLIDDNFELDPVPDINVTDGLWLWYIESPADMSADGDTPDLPLEYSHIPINYALSKAKMRLGMVTEAERALTEFELDLQKMEEEILNRTNDNDYIKITDPY